VSGAAHSDRAVSLGESARSQAGGLAEAKTQVKRPAAVGTSKGTGKNSEPNRDGNGSSANVSRKVLRHKRTAEVVS
jgi:hypothetical protein